MGRSIVRGAKMIKCVVPISGGKDSQACAKLAVQDFHPSEVLGLFCDTKFEHPLTYEHVKRIGQLYGIEIRTVNAGSVEEKVVQHKRFPGGGGGQGTVLTSLKLSRPRSFIKN